MKELKWKNNLNKLHLNQKYHNTKKNRKKCKNEFQIKKSNNDYYIKEKILKPNCNCKEKIKIIKNMKSYHLDHK